MFVVIVGATALTAEPVWSGADGARYVLLRRQVALRPAKVLSATIHVAAVQSDTMERLLGAYRLYVGGKAIGMGPGRGGHRTAAYPDGGDVNHTYYDTYDVSALAMQTNYLVVGLQCYHTTGDKSAGVLLELEITLVDRTKIAVYTSSRDGLWHSFDATAAYGPTGETGQYHAPQEWAQSGLMPTGWTQTGFVIGSAWIPPATRRGTTPSLEPSALKRKPTQALELVTGVRPHSFRQLTSSKYFADFGHALQGGLTLRLPVAAFPVGSFVQVTLGEELVGKLHKSTTIRHPMRTGNRYRNVWTVTPSTKANGRMKSLDESHEVALFEHHEYMLFRYVSLELNVSRGDDGGIGDSGRRKSSSLSGELDLSAWMVRYPWRKGESAFLSSNETLNQVWAFCSDTIKFTSLDTATDGNTRERLPYEADTYITGVSWLALQAERAWVRHSFLHNLWNPTWPTEWRQTAPLMALADYMATGELSLFEQFGEVLSVQTQRACVNATTQLVDFRNCSRQAAGLGVDLPLRDLVDWPWAYRDGYVFSDAANTVVNAYAVGGLRALAHLTQASGNASGAALLAAQADRITDAVNALLWDDKVGAYRDGLEDGRRLARAQRLERARGGGRGRGRGRGGTGRDERMSEALPPNSSLPDLGQRLNLLSQTLSSGAPIEHCSWHATVFAAAFGLVPQARWPRVLAFLQTRRMVGSVYASFYLLQALYQAPADHGNLALEILTSCEKHSWCAMLAAGATATMEAWATDEKPNLSWSHPWATAPASAVVWGLFGVRPLEAGWTAVEVRPQPGNLRWAAITVPSVRGPLVLALNQTFQFNQALQPLQFKLSLTAPKAVRVTACLPKLGLPDATVGVNGVPKEGSVEGDFVCVRVSDAAEGVQLVRSGDEKSSSLRNRID